MTDLDLLNLARKAVGVNQEVFNRESGFPRKEKIWDPFANDSDALRLAADLGISIQFIPPGKLQGWQGVAVLPDGSTKTEYSDNNPRVSVRRAIVAAAAEIGKSC
jgi:hypothetical protein